MEKADGRNPGGGSGQGAPAIGPVSARFLASSALSLLGNSISSVALPLALLVTTGDAIAAGTLALVCMLPQAAAGVVGGGVLDVLNRRDVSAVSDLVSAVSVAMLPVVSLLGMLAGMAVMSLLPTFPLLLLGAAVLGLFSGPFSALLGFRMLEAIPDEVRGSVLGVQNSLLLVVSPASVFAASALTSLLGVNAAAATLAAAWLIFTVYALAANPMRSI